MKNIDVWGCFCQNIKWMPMEQKTSASKRQVNNVSYAGKKLALLSQIWYIIRMHFEVKVLPPAYDFICSLNPKMRAKVYRGIDLLKLFGFRLCEPHAKTLKSAICIDVKASFFYCIPWLT